MHTFTIDGDLYLPFKNSLFRVGETVNTIDELEEDRFYIHKESIGKFELPADYMSFDAIFVSQESPHTKQHYTVDAKDNVGNEFTSARVLHRIVPDQLAECPNCRSAAGEKDDKDSPTCFRCGYGTKDGLHEEQEV